VSITDPLFVETGPRPEDVVQGRLDNCPVAAALMALARATPERIQEMISRIPGQVRYRYRLRAEERLGTAPLSYTVRLPAAAPVRVSNMLYAGPEGILYAHSSNHSAWVSFLEKGYAASKRGGYVALSQVGTGALDAPDTRQVFTEIVGPCDTAYLGERDYRFISHDLQDQPLNDTILQHMFHLARRRPTIAASRPQASRGSGVRAGHSYGVLGFAGGNVHLRDPRGGPDAELHVTLEEFREAFLALLQAAA